MLATTSPGTNTCASPFTHAPYHLPSRAPYAPPVPLQGKKDGEVKFFLHNHLRFTILYHKDQQTDLSRIVGFEVSV